MRFSPHRRIPENTLQEFEPGYDSLSDDSDDADFFPTSSPLSSSGISSPLKSLHSTPSKAPLSSRVVKIRHTYRTIHSSPLSGSPLGNVEPISISPLKTADDTINETANDTIDDEEYVIDDEAALEEELKELLDDLDFKERFLLVKENVKRPSRLRRHTSLNNRSRPTSSKITPLLTESPDDDIQKQLEKLQLQEFQDTLVNSLESRLSQRSKSVEDRVRQIEEHKRKLEEERLRKEAELKRLEEERRKKEQEAKKKAEEEARRLAEAKEKARKEAEEKAKVEAEKAAKLKAEEELKAQKEAEEKAKALKEEESKKGKGVTNFDQVESLFLNYKNKIAQIKTDIVEKVKQDPATKKAVSAHKRKINPKFGQLTNSLTQLSKISTELTHLINEAKPSPLAFQWILNFVSKAIVSQAETEVRAKPSSSLPLAKLTLNLLCEFPELKEYLMARFVKKCPFVIGYSCDISTEEGRLRMGWKRNEDKKWEDEIGYDERMGGMMTLYSVLTRLKVSEKYYNTHQHPIPISQSWILVSRILNTPLDLVTNTHYIVLSSWWEGCASEMLAVYGKQAVKLLNLIWIDFADAALQSKKFSGANTIKAIGEDWANSGNVKRFGEMEP